MIKKVDVTYGPNIRFNLPKILEFVYGDGDRAIDVEFEEMKQPDMDGNLHVTQQFRKEFKHASNNNGAAVRYSLIEMFIREMSDIPISLDPETTSLGGFLIMNTMIDNKFIISDNEEKTE